MPLLQGQPFKLIKPPEIYPDSVNDEIHVIQHTGEKFLNKSDYEDRLALYSQSIWTCQCTGRSGLTHQEAWTSEAKVRVAAMTAVPLSLQKPLLTLVHHSLSPLEQLIDAASILCYSQYHVGEELIYLNNIKSLVRIINSKEGFKRTSVESAIENTIANGIASENNSPVVNGATNGLSNSDSPGSSPGKENQAKELPAKEENGCRKEMLPKLYDILVLEDNTLIENVSTKQLQRSYKLPSKDQIRLFIRSCALRHRGTTCTPWVVSDDLIDKFSIPNKLPTVFLSSPKPKPNSSLSKRKAHSPAGDSAKRTKSDQKIIKPIISSGMSSKVAPLLLKTGNLQKSIFNIVKPELGMLKTENTDVPLIKLPSPEKLNINDKKQQSTSPFRVPLNSLSKSHQSFLPKSSSPTPFNHVTKHPLSLGKPKMLHKSYSLPSKSSSTSAQGSPRKRGRPPLTKEEKERNKKLREAALLDFSKKTAEENVDDLLEIKTHSMMLPQESSAITPYLQTGNPCNPFYSASPYKSPVNRANTPEAVMRLPFMRRYVYEYKTIKGVIGQFRRLAHTMDIVLAKLSPEQIEMIPDEAMKQDLFARQKKVRDKKIIEQMTPEERKQYMRDKARTTALERWKERKLKNLKIEDKTLNDLKTLPRPVLVILPEPLPNAAFGDVVMITEFLKCFRELLLGEEKFLITCCQLMEALIAGAHGFKLIVDILCYLLPTIIHDDDSKNCKELGVNISTIPINFQTAPELARLCLRKQEGNYFTLNQMCDESYQIGMEQTELSDDLLNKLEKCEFWELEFQEIIAVIKALVHKVLSTASLSVFVEEMEEKVLRTLRERRKFLKHLQKSKLSEQLKKKEERIMNKEAKNNKPKKQRGRPKGYSPKLAGLNLQEYLKKKKEEDNIVANSISVAVFKRRTSSENNKKERAEQKKIEQERLKQQEEEQKKLAWDKKYDDIILKKDNLLRCTPIGYDRNHNRYWIFHTSTPGLYVEKGWVDYSSNYRISTSEGNIEGSMDIAKEELELVIKSESSDDEKPLSIIMKSQEEEEDKPLSTIKKANEEEEDNKPLSFVKSKLEEQDEDNKSLATIKSKLSISPMKMTCRGRPPKEAYVLVDEDTQTFPTIGENMWFYYKSLEDVQNLYDCLTDKGHRESQLRAAISLNMDRLQRLFASKSEAVALSDDTPNHLKQSLKEDIAQIERELIEGWLGGITEFDKWEKDVLEAESVSEMGPLLIEAQKHMQLKYLKGLMAPEKKQLPLESPDALPEYEEVEGLGVQKWRDAVMSCKTYSRLHVLVGLFDSCIKWEKSMATRKCRICRSKTKDDPLLMCDKCENSFHWYCLRPPLKEEPGENWLCPACMPKKTRREESANNNDMTNDDPEEKDDPTFAINKQGRIVSSGRNGRSKNPIVNKKLEKQCEVCYGRIGLISCCKCSAAYHSECHDPPLLSRARKDWACGKCSNSKSNTQDAAEDVNAEYEPRYRRNIFDNLDDANKDPKPRIVPPRGRSGRFVKQDGLAIAMCGITDDGSDNNSMADEQSAEENALMTADRFGRSVRGAKVKALETMTTDEGSRRSSRNLDKKTKYQYDSDDEGSDEDDEEEIEDDESNKEVSGEEDELIKEVPRGVDQNGEENSDIEAVDVITLEDTDGEDLKSSDNGDDSSSDNESDDSDSNSTNGNEEPKNVSESQSSSDESDDSDSSQSDVEDISRKEGQLTFHEG